MGSWVFGDWLSRMIKGNSVFTPMQWKAMGQEMPKQIPHSNPPGDPSRDILSLPTFNNNNNKVGIIYLYAISQVC